MRLADYTLVVATARVSLLCCLLVLLIVSLQIADVVLKTKLVQGVHQVVPVDCLAVATPATLASLACDERNVLGDALLDGFACFLRDLCVLG